jgi:hypothetical protein
MMSPKPPVLRENLIRLAAVDFLTFSTGPWNHDLMADGVLRPTGVIPPFGGGGSVLSSEPGTKARRSLLS